MFYLLCSIGCSVLIAITLKKAQGTVKNKVAMFMANYIICIICGYYFNGKIVFAKEASFSFILGIFSGMMYLVSFLISDKDIALNGVIMQSVFSKLGVLVPTTFSIILFKQHLTNIQFVGVAIAIFAIILIYFEKDSVAFVTAKSWLIFNLLTSGIADMMISLYDHYGNPLFKNQYLLLNFAFAFLFSIMFLLFKKEKICKYDILFGFLIGVPNYFSSRFMMLALEQVKAIVAYPIVSIGTIGLITLIGHYVFKEPLSLKKWISLGLISIAVIFLR